MLNQQPLYYERTTYGYARTCLSFGGVAWSIKKSGRCIGTLISNHNRDEIREILHEDQYSIGDILKAWQRESQVKWIEVQMPAWQKKDRMALNAFAEGVSYGMNNDICILRYRRVLEAMLTLKASYNQMANGEMGFRVDGQTWTVKVQNGTVTTMDGAENPLELTHNEAGNLFLMPFEYDGKPDTPQGWFPLPIYTCSADEF